MIQNQNKYSLFMMSNTSRKGQKGTQLPLHKQNYDKLMTLLQERVKMVSESNAELQIKYERMKNQLQYARPSDIRISSGDDNESNKEDDHDVLKKLVQAAISGQHNSTFDEKELQLFQRQNNEIESQISEKMKSIEDIDQEIKQTQIKQEQAICELQKSEQLLKHILKSKGSLEQAERCEKDKKMRLVEVRSLREMLKSLKNKKINKIKEVIECLNLLLQYRNQRMRKIEKMGKFCPHSNKSPLETQTRLLYEFVKNMEYLKQQKDKMQQDKKIYRGFDSFSNIHEFEQSTKHDNSCKKRLSSSNLSYNSTPKHSLSGNTSSLMQTQKKEVQKKNNNQLSTKKLGNLNSTITFPIKSQIKSFKSFEQIIQAYEQVLQFMDSIKDAQIMYFKNRNDKLEQQYKVKAMEKSYLIGILGYNPVQSEKYDRIVKFAIKKCVQFSQVINQKAEQRTKLQNSIKSVEQSSQILKSQISTTQSQKQRKSSILSSLQTLIQQTSKQMRRPQIKELQQEMEQNRTLKLQYTKEQEQYAEQGDLENYKRINNAIENLDSKRKQVEKKLKQEEQYEIKHCQNVYGHDNCQFWGKVRELMGKYGVDMDVFRKIEAKTASQLYAKFTKRLTSI